MNTPQRTASFGSAVINDMEKQGTNVSPTLGPYDEKGKQPVPAETERFPSMDHPIYFQAGDGRAPMSRINDDQRAQAFRLNDELIMAQVERSVSNQEKESVMRRSRSLSHIRRGESIVQEDIFNLAAPSLQAVPPPSAEAANKLNKALVKVRKLPRVLRYIFYMLPVCIILLVPILIGLLAPGANQTGVGGGGGVQLLWFGIWLEIIWLVLWAARIVAGILPLMCTVAAKISGSGNPKKWTTAGVQMELPTALFLWMLAVLISFHPILNNHKVPAGGDDPYPEVSWIQTVHKIIIALFVLASLNFVEKMLIQWIANSFHLRTYSDRIQYNKQNIAYLVHLYEHSGDTLVSEQSVMPTPGINSVGQSGTRTPLATLQNNAKLLQNNAKQALNKVGDVANRVAGDFTGREVRLRNHPRKIVSELLRNSNNSQVLARRLFRTYAKADPDNPDLAPEEYLLKPHDLRAAFPTDEDAETAFNIFDRDLNGDVSQEELMAFVDEVHREKKAIAASLKDLDTVIRKLDSVFMVLVMIVAIIVFISIISTSAAASLASASTVVLGLSWLLQATAQEFLQSIIFVFVKHPFDVGDRVTVYGNTGSKGIGDDYYVTAISLLYTEFKKMEGHIVQAPNSLLNTLFILNQRRSGSISDVFELKMKHGTPRQLIEELQARMTEFVLEHRRDFTGKILTEVRTIEDAYAITVNFICFHKSSFQNELLRLTRHNKFALELMAQMVKLGIEQPRKQYQISGHDFPVYQTNIQPPAYSNDHKQDNQPVDPAMLTATRRVRSSSRVSLNKNSQDDFYQDVTSSRKHKANNHHPPCIAEEEDTADQDDADGAALDTTMSKASGSQRGGPRQGLFKRTMTLRQASSSRDRASSNRSMV